MADIGSQDLEGQALLTFLNAQRACVLAIVDGLGEDAPFTTSRPTEVVFAFYRDQIERANAVLASTPLSARPLGRHNREGADEVTDLRFIVLHMIEETARHAGHLDIARELIDGQTGLGPR